MRGFILGVIVTLLLIAVGGYLFVRSGGVSLATTSAPMPLEEKVAHMALRASIGKAGTQKDPLPVGDENLLAGVTVYRNIAQSAMAHHNMLPQ